MYMVFRKISRFIAIDNEMAMIAEARRFGKRSAHVTVPAEWKGKQLLVRLATKSEIARRDDR
jgi:hypothetical protein